MKTLNLYLNLIVGLELVNNEKTNAKCNKYAIIIYCIVVSISHESIILTS